ncbi:MULTISPECIES: flavin reductase family protein [Streptomyces]|uniref:3-hydroxy-9,10-secoandrosta-1,3,5(10)-triene-9,17-dione monooxygenase reductase component n=1 Tax=Streptomyces pini TaxID=1520580 RepID=A0A1I4ICP3_9ACTN|nr:flavin reductase family protein [Streptomyces pini]SFL52119.1 3-hydroxy-9,10-secoandrosta-1,3,5(10)-triene-9,17-dione monooxygenase reductase component [Streptomyces pini]
MTDTGTTLLAGPEPDISSFRTAMGCFPTGVTLLTQGSGDTLSVMTLNSLTSVSLDPMLLLVSVKRDGRMRPRVAAGGGFAVNVLAEEHRLLSGEFARPDRPVGEEAMRRIGAVEGITGNAVVPSASASFECLLHAEHEAGDHVLLVGQVVALSSEPGARPLLFHRGRYASLR